MTFTNSADWSYLSRNTTEWCLCNAQKSSLSPGVAIEDLDLFRVGDFSNATSSLKEKWYTVMLDLLPCISKKYIKAVRASEVATKITTASDEAMLLWLLALNSAKWTEMALEKLDERPTKRTRTGKQVGTHDSRVEMSLYYELYKRTLAARNDTKTGEEWDRALIEEAIRRHGNNNKGHKGKPTNFNRETYVLCYSPGKEPHLERKEAPVPYEV